MTTLSLRRRLLLAGGLLLLVFVLLSGLALDTAINRYARQAEYQRLQGIEYSLLAAIDVDELGRVELSAEGIPETRLQEPDSGLSAYVLDASGRLLWQSVSAAPLSADREPPQVGVGEWLFHYDGHSSLAFGFEWDEPGREPFRYTLMVKDSASPIGLQQAEFSKKLWWGLLFMAALLLLLLLGLFAWGLRPLRTVVEQLRAIRRGEAESLQGEVPEEIRPLTRSINELLAQERQRQQRYRHAMGDLAHSLKTPLAILKGKKAGPPEMEDQLARMDQIIDYQLQRASAAGGKLLHARLPLRSDAERVASALGKVYADKSLTFHIDIPQDLTLPIEQGDWLEILGNLLDNAAKYGSGKVRVSGRPGKGGLLVSVEDDGEGFPEGAGVLVERGVRADTLQPGQGIGLSVVRDIVDGYGGQMEIGRSDWGGGKVELVFPRS